MHITALTLFPEFFDGPLQVSIPGRAIARERLRVDCVNPRDFATDTHGTVDDTPYGGGAGMVMRAPELNAALDHAQNTADAPRPVVLLSPQGARLTQNIVDDLAQTPGFILVCGRYEGLDERFVTTRVDHEISVGDFVLSGGEPGAFVIIDAVARLLEGVVGNQESVILESFQDGTLEHPHFTRPYALEDDAVPDILRSGDHPKIAKWRRKISLLRTRERRPDLWKTLTLSRSDRRLLEDSKVPIDARWYEASRTQGVNPPSAEPEDAGNDETQAAGDPAPTENDK